MCKYRLREQKYPFDEVHCSKFGVGVIPDICNRCEKDVEEARAILRYMILKKNSGAGMHRNHRICIKCEHYKSCGNYCLLLTRRIKLSLYWDDGKCPLGKWESIRRSSSSKRLIQE